VQWVCEQASFEVQSAYFRAWVQCGKNAQALSSIMLFIFAEFDTLRQYCEQRVRVVTAVRREEDRHRQDCLEDLLSMVLEAVELDYAFLLSKGEQAFLAFLQMLDTFFTKSFSAKLRILSVQIIASICSQFTNFSAQHDPEQGKRQAYERTKLSYTPSFNSLPPPSPELIAQVS
jgi:hypothetical protein